MRCGASPSKGVFSAIRFHVPRPRSIDSGSRRLRMSPGSLSRTPLPRYCRFSWAREPPSEERRTQPVAGIFAPRSILTKIES